MRLAHVAFKFGFRHKGRHTVDHQNVNRAGSHKGIGNLQGLLARIGLRNQQVVDIHPQFCRIAWIKGVFRINKRTGAAGFLCLGDDVQREGGLARAFRAVNFNHPSAWQAADAQRDIQAKRSG